MEPTEEQEDEAAREAATRAAGAAHAGEGLAALESALEVASLAQDQPAVTRLTRQIERLRAKRNKLL